MTTIWADYLHKEAKIITRLMEYPADRISEDFRVLQGNVRLEKD